MEQNKTKDLMKDPDNKEVPHMKEDSDNNIENLENDEISHIMSKDNTKLKSDETTYTLKNSTENTDNNNMKGNNKDSIKKIKMGEEDIRTMGTNNSRESKINRSNSLPEGINNIATKHSWAEEIERADIIGELLKEDTEKRKIIEDLVKEKERLKTKPGNKDEIIKNLIIGKYEEDREEINIETSFNRGHHIRNIKTRVKKIEGQLDIKNNELRIISNKVGDLFLELD